MIPVITHKIFNDSGIDTEAYFILHVGSNPEGKEFYRCDDTGDNISVKNCSFCELTGLYWVWKNFPEEKDAITGLVHYRRYFTSVFREWLYTYMNIDPGILPYKVIKRTLTDYDIILPKPECIIRTVKEFYSDNHNSSDLEVTRNVITSIVPEYLASFDRVMGEHHFYYGNMMLCKRKTMEEYCNWLFPILFQVEKNLDIENRDSYQRRVIGFLAERLLQVWVEYNHLRIKHYAVYNTESKRITAFRKTYNRLYKLFTGKRAE